MEYKVEIEVSFLGISFPSIWGWGRGGGGVTSASFIQLISRYVLLARLANF